MHNCMVSSFKMTMLRTTGKTTEAGAGEESKGKVKRGSIRDEVMEEEMLVQVNEDYIK